MSKEEKTVLVLDDDSSVRNSLVSYFEDCRWKVVQAETAEEAIKKLKYEKVDCTVTDIRLPGINGDKFIETVNSTHPQIVHVIVTGSPEYHPPGKITSLEQVSDKIFDKPVMDLGVLEQELLRMIEKQSEN